MRISTDVLQTLNEQGVDVSSAWLWVDNDSYDGSYRQVLEQPISLEAVTLDFLRWKVSTITLTIRASDSITSNVLFAGEAALVDDAQGTVAANHNDLLGISGEYPYYHLSAAAHSLINGEAALTGTGALLLTSSVPSLIGIGTANGLCGLGSDSRVAWANLPASLSGAVHYVGTWDASTNTPTLPDPTTNNGAYYAVSVAGSYSGIQFAVGDACISNGTSYEKIDNTQLVTSVFGRVGAIAAAATDYSSYYPRLDNTYTDPSWIGSLAWTKISGKPSTLSGYGVASTDTLFDTKYLGINANAATASKLAAARTIAMSGDGTWSTSFDGSANATGALTLATVNSNVGSFGSGYQVPYITVNAKGQVTAVANYNITIPHTQISDWSTATSSFLTASQAISLKGAVTGSGTTSIATSFANTHLAGINQDLSTASSPTFINLIVPEGGGYYGGIGYGAASGNGNAGNYGSWTPVARIAITPTYCTHEIKISHDFYGEQASSIFDVKICTNKANGSDAVKITCTGYACLACVYYLVSNDIIYLWLYRGGGNGVGNYTSTITHSSSIGNITLVADGSYVTTQPTGSAIVPGATWDMTSFSISQMLYANGGITGSLTGHASLDLPLAGGTMDDNSGIRVEGAQSGGFVTQYKNASYPNDLRLAGISSGYFNFGYNSSLFSSLSFIGTSYSAGYVKLDGPGTSGNLMANKFILAGGSAAQFLKADGSVDKNVYLPLSGTASNASALGGVASDYFVQGQNATRTVIQPTAATSQSQLFKSGFYCSSVWTDAPVASTWTHLIHTQYGNDGGSSNTWSFDIAANFGSAADPGSPEGYYVRAIALGSSTGWRQLIHSANYTAYNNFTSGLSASNLTVDNAIHADSLWLLANSFTINSPSPSTILLGLTSCPMHISPSDGYLTLPNGLGIGGTLSLASVGAANATYSSTVHKGKLVIIAQSNFFTLPASASVGDWCIVCSVAVTAAHADPGSIRAPGGMYVRGGSTTGTSVPVCGAMVAAFDGSHWYVG